MHFSVIVYLFICLFFHVETQDTRRAAQSPASHAVRMSNVCDNYNALDEQQQQQTIRDDEHP